MKLMGIDSGTSGQWSRTSMINNASARDADMSKVTIQSPSRDPPLDIRYMKSIGVVKRTSWRWSLTSMTNDASTKDADLSPVTILSPMDPPI